MSDTDRLRGLRRWEKYLITRIKPWGTVRESGDEPETRDAVWRVGYPDDTRARIRVTDEALRLDQDGFEDLAGQLQEADRLGLLRKAREESGSIPAVEVRTALALHCSLSPGDPDVPAR